MNRGKRLTERVVVPHNKLRHAADQAASRAREGGGMYDCLTAILFSALTLEAFLNALGMGVVRGWEVLERKLSPQEKLSLLAKRLEYEVDFGSRPFQTFSVLMAFRNDIVHAKPETTAGEVEGEGHDICRQLETGWEKMCTAEWAERAVRDRDAIMDVLFRRSGLYGDVQVPLWLFLYEDELREMGSRLPS